MASRAAFKIRNITTAGAWSPSTVRGFDAAAGDVLELQLEASPALDVQAMRFFQAKKAKGSTDLTFPAGGVASPPTVAVQITLPAGAAAWLVSGETNGGEAVIVSGLKDYTVNNFTRAIAVRSGTGRRKIIPVESTEYDPVYGWTGEQNDSVDASLSISGTAPIAVSAGVVSIVAATSLVPGSMSAADYAKLLALPTAAALTASLLAITNRLDAIEAELLLLNNFNVTSVKTGAYPAVIDDLVRCDASAGGFTVTLPTAVGMGGRGIAIAKTVSTSNAVTVATTSSQTIDGASTFALSLSTARAIFVSDNANWLAFPPA